LCRGQRSSVDVTAGALEAQQWLEARPAPIAASSRPALAEGLALLDGELAGPLFNQFFRGRETDAPLPAGLGALLRAHLGRLAEHHGFTAVTALPSRDWRQRAEALELAAQTLGVPALPELLVWREEPA